MTISVNNENLIFKKCLSGMNSKVEIDIWKSFINLNNDKVEVVIINECEICNSKLNDEINWTGVVDFLERLPKELNDLMFVSQKNLLHLARQMKFWKDEFEQESSFFLDAVEYLSVNLKDEKHKYAKFANHTFQLIFTLESKKNNEIDRYGRWITKWTGQQITEIKREQFLKR
jgi:hypothetical protein